MIYSSNKIDAFAAFELIKSLPLDLVVYWYHLNEFLAAETRRMLLGGHIRGANENVSSIDGRLNGLWLHELILPFTRPA